MNRKILAFFLSLFLSSPSLFAYRSQYIVADGPKENALLDGYGNIPPIEAVLAASGVPESDFPRFTAEFQRWEDEIRSSLPPQATQYQTAEAILAYIHSKVFSRYHLESTTLVEVFRDGRFNCLSATIVNGVLLQAFGIPVSGVVLPTHVYIVATLDGKPTEIENTIAQGLLISQDKNLQKQFNTLTGFTYGGGTKKVVISWPETVGILYSNRAYFDSQRKRFEDAFQNMMKAQTLLASAPSERKNLTAGYLNYSYYIIQRKNRPAADYYRALEVLQEGIGRYPNVNELKQNYSTGVQILLRRMAVDETPDSEIDTFLEESRPYMLSKDYTLLANSRYPLQLNYYIKTKKDFPAAQRVLVKWFRNNPNGKEEKTWVHNYGYELIQADLKNNSGAANPEVLASLKEFPVDVVGELYGFYYSELASKLFKSKNYEAAVAMMEDGLKSVGRETYITENGFVMAVNTAVVYFNKSRLEDALSYYKRAEAFKKTAQLTRDMATVYGNLAAMAANRQDLASARRWVQEGLQVAPNDRRLRSIQAQL